LTRRDEVFVSAPQSSANVYGGGRQNAAFTAACPTCDTDAEWFAGAHIEGDLSRTDVSYRIDCPACTSAPISTERTVVPLRPVSQLGWMGRSA
jgi:hypothetical protein